MLTLVEKSFQEKTNKFVNDINTFLRERGKEVASKDRNIAIINTQSGQFYSINADNHKRLFDIIDNARKSNAKISYSEYQRAPSAVCIDLLFKHCYQDHVKLTSLNSFINKLCDYIIKIITGVNAELPTLPEFIEIRIARKQALIPADRINQNQELYRIILNNIHVGKDSKFALLNALNIDKVLERTFGRELGLVKNYNKVIDSIQLHDICIVEPITILGSGDVPFVHHCAFKYDTYDNTLQSIELDPATCNISLEYSILHAPNPHIYMKPDEIKEEETKDNTVAREDIELIINQINEEKIQSDVLLYKYMLEILESHKNDYNNWEIIITALARSSQIQPVIPGEHDRHWLLAQW